MSRHQRSRWYWNWILFGPIPIWELFRFCLGLVRASYSNLHPTDEVLFFTHLTSGLSVITINSIHSSVWYRWLPRSASLICIARRISFIVSSKLIQFGRIIARLLLSYKLWTWSKSKRIRCWKQYFIAATLSSENNSLLKSLQFWK